MKPNEEPIKTLYGPPPVLRKKKSLWGVIIIVISVILGGLIYYGYKMISTVYGPPPVDTVSNKVNMLHEAVYGPPPIDIDERQKMINESPMKEDALHESRD